MADRQVPDPGRRRFLGDLLASALQDLADFLRALNDEVGAPSLRELEEVRAEVADLEDELQERLEDIEQEIQTLQEQDVRDREALLEAMRRLERRVTELAEQVQRVENPARRRRLLAKLKYLIPLIIAKTGDALYENLVQDELYPEFRRRLEQLQEWVDATLERPEPTPTPTPQRISATPLEPELVFIPGGRFLMGSDKAHDPEAHDDELPQHEVYIPDFHIARYPITNMQYKRFVDATGHDVPRGWNRLLRTYPLGKGRHPVVGVTWHDAVAYCEWLSRTTRKRYRLPSEAEWEKAARGGLFLDGDASARVPNPNPRRIYPCGDRFDRRKCNCEESGIGGTTPVDRYPAGASPYGVMDMAGNVWEWTRSLWGEGWEWDPFGGLLKEPTFKYPYDADDGREDLNAPEGMFRVLRGGSFGLNRRVARCASRGRDVPSGRFGSGGFRVVLLPSPSGL